jgi:hypothetical protein
MAQQRPLLNQEQIRGLHKQSKLLLQREKQSDPPKSYREPC